MIPWQMAEQTNKLWCAKAALASRFDLPSEVPEAIQQKLNEMRTKGMCVCVRMM